MQTGTAFKVSQYAINNKYDGKTGNKVNACIDMLNNRLQWEKIHAGCHALTLEMPQKCHKHLMKLRMNVFKHIAYAQSILNVAFLFVVAVMVIVAVWKDLLRVTYCITLIWKGNWTSAGKRKLSRSWNRCFKLTQKASMKSVMEHLAYFTCTLGNSNDNFYAQNALIMIRNSSFLTAFWGLLTRWP